MYEEKYNIKVDMTFTAINTSDDGRYESVGDEETSSASEDTQKEKITETTTEKATETDEETEETDYVIPYSSDRYLTMMILRDCRLRNLCMQEMGYMQDMNIYLMMLKFVHTLRRNHGILEQ